MLSYNSVKESVNGRYRVTKEGVPQSSPGLRRQLVLIRSPSSDDTKTYGQLRNPGVNQDGPISLLSLWENLQAIVCTLLYSHFLG